MMKHAFLILSVLVTLASSGAGAERSRSEAVIRLLNSRASGSPRGYAEAAEIVAEDAANGKPLQQFVIALASKDPDAPAAAKIDKARRDEYLRSSRDKIKNLAEQRGNALAWYLLSLENNDQTMLKRAAEGGNVQALNSWGTITLTKALRDLGDDTNDVERVLKKSFSLYKRAAEQNDANGLYNLGMCYLQGYGTARDLDNALDCFRTAAEAGHPEAINNIGGFYRDGVVVEKDPVIATRWFSKSAAMENAYGLLNYGLALQRGEGVAADSAQAVELYKKSLARGSVEAVNAYAMCLFNGDGVAEDKAAAVALYRQAAERGFPPAMENLAACYDAGLGGLKRDVMMSAVWKARARAARGDRNAAAWLSGNGY